MSLQVFKVSLVRKLSWLVRLGLFSLALVAYSDERLVAAVSPQLLDLVLVGVSASFVLSTLQILLVSMYRRRQKLPVGESDNFILGINALARLVFLVVVIGSVFPIFGIPFGTFLTSLSVFSVAIAWLFKEYLTNYFASFRLMFSTDLRIGDYIKVGEASKGVITDITLRATKVKTDEGDILFIPNTDLMNNQVTNYSKVKFKRVIVPFSVKTDTIPDVSSFERFLAERVHTALPEVVDPNRTFLRLVAVENGYTKCAFELSIDQYSFKIEDQLQRTILEGVIAWRTLAYK